MSDKRKNRDLSERRRKMQEKGRIPWGYVLPLIVVIVIVISLVSYNAFFLSRTTTSSDSHNFPFPCLGSEGTSLHIHPYLQIKIDGANIPIPADIGIVSTSSGQCFEPIHTHDSSGIIHIESPTANVQYTLNDFFEIWNDTYGSVAINGTIHPIVFNSTDILGFRADSTHKVVLLVDGSPSTALGSLVLNSLDYCSSSNSNTPPCYPTAGGNPYYNGQQYPYGTGHTIVIEYEKS